MKVPVNISDRTLSFVVIFKHFLPLGNPSVDINGTWQEGSTFVLSVLYNTVCFSF